MMTKISSAFILLAIVVVLSCCAPASTPLPPTMTPVPPTYTSPLPTSTPLPPTSTPEPTPTATPIIYNVKIDVVDESGNPIQKAKIIQAETPEYTDDLGVWSKSFKTPELSLRFWSQGYSTKEQTTSLQPGDNKITVQLSADSYGLKADDLSVEGYELIFVEDFQDNLSDCMIEGNGAVVPDDADVGNYLLLVDLRNLDDGFVCRFGPTGLQDAIIEVDFRYPEIRYSDFTKDNYNWQGYSIQFRDGFDVQGYPLKVPWGATMQIRDFSGADWEFPATVKQNIQENRWYRLNTSYMGKQVDVRLDGAVKFRFLQPPTMVGSEPSSIGAFSQAYIQFDNIKMWVPVK